jgi:hypothetical protein
MYSKRIAFFGLLAAVVMGWGVSPPAAAQTLAGAGDAPSCTISWFSTKARCRC